MPRPIADLTSAPASRLPEPLRFPLSRVYETLRAYDKQTPIVKGDEVRVLHDGVTSVPSSSRVHRLDEETVESSPPDQWTRRAHPRPGRCRVSPDPGPGPPRGPGSDPSR